MLKKNMRKRLLAGALATIMALTMCPTWALAVDGGITTLPAPEGQMPAVDSTPTGDTIQTPDAGTQGQTKPQDTEQAGQLENQDSEQAPSGGTDIEETGNNSSSNENDSQNNDAESNAPENEISVQEPQVDLAWWKPQPQEAMYFILLPKRGTPKTNADQGQENYLPSSDNKALGITGSDGGVLTLNADTGYEGFLTDAGKKKVRYIGDSVTDIEHGLNDSGYLDVPDNLGFFTPSNWNGNTYTPETHTTIDARNALLGESFNGTGFQIVWYTIKHQSDGYHVDGYLKGVDVNVTYHSNFGDDDTYVVTATTGDEYQALTTYGDTSLPERSGYTFVDWYKDANCTEVYEPTTLMGDLHLYAKWVKNAYNVEYYVDGNKVDSSVKRVNSTVTVSSDRPTKEGYTFKKWETKDVTVDVDNDTFTMPEKDVRFDAEFEINKYTVTWENENNSFITSAEVAYKNTPKSNPTVSKDSDKQFDYEFAGWKVKGDESNRIVNPTEIEVTDNVTYVAVFNPVPHKYTVTWVSEGKKLDDEQVAYGKMPNKTFTPEKKSTPEFDYEFLGWKVKDGSDALVNPNTTAVIADVTYEAVFKQITRQYTVTWKNSDDAADSLDTQTVDYNNKPTKDPRDQASKASDAQYTYEFKGWKLKDDKTDTIVEPKNRAVTENVTYVAVFEPVTRQYTVTYYVDGKKQGDEETYNYGTRVKIRDNAVKEGHTFSGWKIGNETAKEFDIKSDVTIEGFFTQNKYSYTINKHFYNEKDVEVKVENGENKTGNEYALVAELYKNDAVNQTVDGKNYVYVPGLTKVTDNLEKLTKDVTIDLYYYLDVKGGEKPDETGNGTPDAWEYRLAFKVVNGEWNNGGSADIVVYVPFKDYKTGKTLKYVVVPITSIPAVGDKPNSGYRAGSWDTTPVGNAKVEKDTVFTYTYAKKSSSGGGGGGGSHKPTVTIPDDVPTGLNGDDHYAYIVGYPDSTVRPQNGITRAEVATIFFRLLTDETRNANSTKSNSYSDVAAGAWYNHAVSTLSAMGIVKGDSHGKFNPNAPITRAEFAAIAARFDDKANTTAVDFSDIASHWAKNEISAAANNGWINGYTDGTFRPNNKITRAEAMTLVNRVLKRLPETAEDLHNDMIKWSDNSDTSAWYYLAVQEATNSHYYDLKENKHEKWSKLRETRDWTELEK
ncbi:S-layer homology domain-containing protein [Agathobaculum butyriciproducens]|uniref:S-layer homology domain-containing protein n=1 Tax=Agathobaculum butyriciproducens TaxID=1628085 RepID=UPI003AB66F09